jgi:four helix bundle protein|tara:strand:- start:127 stop:474 length:348 start_codon:yes stop_codon:yes gene_type:complete
MAENVIRTKSFDFAVDVVKLYKDLVENEREFVMSKQLLRSGTSIGANVREAEFARSRPDFINKMTIGLKEANETDYWLDLLHKTKFINKEDYSIYKEKIQEILRLLVSIVKSSKR